ncbi:MAG: hypothetical protein AAEI08_03705 [Gammaproteobacteria bacterium]
MEICHDHNLNCDLTGERLFGIRVSLHTSDTFNRLIGADWEQFHWYQTSRQRDQALEEMASEHLYSRRGDHPTSIFEPVDRSNHTDSA